MQDYGIKSILDIDTTGSSDLNWSRRTFPDFLVEDCFVGKEDELRTLVSLLVGGDNHRVISVWSMGGIGKTTIAKNAYNHRTVTSFFESFDVGLRYSKV
ncbi:hypothetical protein SASPL_109325 [Salvia splendens]|uniref:NB-ARC domain-containing protein n=1 Tax=Salvia splendens TaxID=180675 RepID=A0A8X9A703_SALSN|nr:hypothetical protein SASPL_109325 [Salvia splendens]